MDSLKGLPLSFWRGGGVVPAGVPAHEGICYRIMVLLLS